MDQETENRTRMLAYELWVAADRPGGSHLRFWKEAELLIAALDAASDGHRPYRVDPKR